MTDEFPPPGVRAPVVRVVNGGRSRRQSERDITTVTMRFRAVAADPATYLASLAIPVRPPRSPGKPGHYPHWAYTVFAALIGPNGSARTVGEDLQDKDTWRMFVDGAREHLGDHAVEGVRATGPARHHWNTWAATYGAYNVAPLGEAFRRLALAQAVDQGLLDPDAPGTTSRPHRTTLVTGDGKVMSSPSRNREAFRVDKRTGERVPQRVDPASGDWKEGGEDEEGRARWEFGSKFVCLSARSDDYYARVVLDIEHLPHFSQGGTGEAALAVDMLLRLKSEAGDGMKAAVWDGALYSKHIDPLMRAGLLVVSPMTAASDPDRRKRNKEKPRVEKTAVLDPYDGGHGCPGHDLWAVNGHVHERHVTSDGTPHDQPLAYRLLTPRGDDGQSRWYHEVRIPCGDPDANGRHRFVHTTQVPVYRIAADAQRGRKGDNGFNRAEYLRQLPPDGEDYEQAYRARNDSESLNSQLESMHYFHRLPAYGAARQTLVMIGAVMSENSVSRYHHARRQARVAAAA